MTVRWKSATNEPGVVRFGTEPNRLEDSVVEPEARTYHEVRLTGLQPSTRYYYSTGTRDQTQSGGPDYWFHTSPPPGDSGPVRIWVQGDPGYWSDDSRAVLDAMLQWTARNSRTARSLIDLWLTTGDNAYKSGTEAEFQESLFQPYSSLLRNIPYVPTYGNHDARGSAFPRLFSTSNGSAAQPGLKQQQHYYSFDTGAIHFIMLDSTSGKSMDQAQLDWLRNDLKNNQGLWTIAILHHPPYTRGSHDSDSWLGSGGRMADVRSRVVPILENGGVDLVLSGHSHAYERSYLLACHYGPSRSLRPEMILDSSPGRPEAPYRKALARVPHGGTVYAVIGASAKVDDAPLNHPAHAVSLGQLGSAVIDIAGPRMDVYFIDSAGEQGDHFRIEKTSDPGTVPPDCGRPSP